LRETVLPTLEDKAVRGDSVRLWSAGCSGGQEPYTIAMEVLKWMPDASQLDIKILATDIDPNMIEKGNEGTYSSEDVEGIEEAQRSRFFHPIANTDNYQADDKLRQIITFRELNLFKKWPMKRKFDVIFCRNVVIYFEPEDQARLWKKFASVLEPDGWLFLGHSERLSGQAASMFNTCGITAHRMDGKHEN
jgi:chemotaxis protein methyltransferase CheR